MVMFSHRSGSSNDRVETSAEKGRKFIDYATKLGYDRRLAEIAVQRLGGGASTNDLLRTVINLYSEKKKIGGNSSKGNPMTKRY
ncbi:hypothetical protein ACHWQZ_G001026 [Mnemiopsis leidyi]